MTPHTILDDALTAPALVEMLGRYRFRYSDEDELQAGIEQALRANGAAFERERSLSRPDRPDFLVAGGLAIEVKIKGSLAELLRQVSRYAAHDEVTSIVVVGTPHWLRQVPESIGGKPLHALRLIGSLL